MIHNLLFFVKFLDKRSGKPMTWLKKSRTNNGYCILSICSITSR